MSLLDSQCSQSAKRYSSHLPSLLLTNGVTKARIEAFHVDFHTKKLALYGPGLWCNRSESEYMDKVKIRLRKNECMTLLTVKLVKTLEQGIQMFQWSLSLATTLRWYSLLMYVWSIAKQILCTLFSQLMYKKKHYMKRWYLKTPSSKTVCLHI